MNWLAGLAFPRKGFLQEEVCMRQKLGLLLGLVLVVLALKSSPAQALTCIQQCGNAFFTCTQACQHNTACTDQCQAQRSYCYCHNCNYCP